MEIAQRHTQHAIYSIVIPAMGTIRGLEKLHVLPHHGTQCRRPLVTPQEVNGSISRILMLSFILQHSRYDLETVERVTSNNQNVPTLDFTARWDTKVDRGTQTSSASSSSSSPQSTTSSLGRTGLWRANSHHLDPTIELSRVVSDTVSRTSSPHTNKLSVA